MIASPSPTVLTVIYLCERMHTARYSTVVMMPLLLGS